MYLSELGIHLGKLFQCVRERLVGADIGPDRDDVATSATGQGRATQSGVGGQSGRLDRLEIGTALHVVQLAHVEVPTALATHPAQEDVAGSLHVTLPLHDPLTMLTRRARAHVRL